MNKGKLSLRAIALVLVLVVLVGAIGMLWVKTAKIQSQLDSTKTVSSTSAELASIKEELASTSAELASTSAELASTSAELASTSAELSLAKNGLVPAKAEFDVSTAPKPESAVKISSGEFDQKIFEAFQQGWKGSQIERTVLEKGDVENLIEWAKPLITSFHNQGRILVLFGIILETPEWGKSTIGLYDYDGELCLGFYTTEGWYKIDSELKIEPYSPAGLRHPLSIWLH